MPVRQWVATLSILRNRVVLLQLGWVYAIPLLVLAAILAVILRPSGTEEWRFLGGIVLVTAGVYLALLSTGVLVVYGGRYEVEFRMDEEGIGGRPHGRTAMKNRLVNRLLLLSGNPTAAGAGMLAEARQVEYVAWRDVDTVASDARRGTIVLGKGRWPRMVVACPPGDHAAVEAYARDAIERARTRRGARRGG